MESQPSAPAYSVSRAAMRASRRSMCACPWSKTAARRATSSASRRKPSRSYSSTNLPKAHTVEARFFTKLIGDCIRPCLNQPNIQPTKRLDSLEYLRFIASSAPKRLDAALDYEVVVGGYARKFQPFHHSQNEFGGRHALKLSAKGMLMSRRCRSAATL